MINKEHPEYPYVLIIRKKETTTNILDSVDSGNYKTATEPSKYMFPSYLLV